MTNQLRQLHKNDNDNNNNDDDDDDEPLTRDKSNDSLTKLTPFKLRKFY